MGNDVTIISQEASPAAKANPAGRAALPAVKPARNGEIISSMPNGDESSQKKVSFLI
jgi:hypothetical protein